MQTWRAILRRAVAWKTARYTKGDIEATVVGITDADGTVGYGYMPSMSIVGESPRSSESLIQTLLAPVMKDRSFIGIQSVLLEVEQVLGGNFQTKFAIEEALWDLLAKKLQTPVVNLIGGACRLEVPVMRMLGLKPPQETAAEAKAMVERGYRHVKVTRHRNGPARARPCGRGCFRFRRREPGLRADAGSSGVATIGRRSSWRCRAAG